MNSIILSPPLISSEHIKEKIICIRGHRERIFRVEIEHYNNKLICHNYGQGGAGWTFLFGCVNESIRQFEYCLEQHPQFKKKPIAIVGAGCFGLLTAILLARKDYNVHIIARDFDNVSSNKAAGFFFPRPRKSSTSEERAVFHKLGIESYTHYLNILRGKHPFINYGPQLMPAYFGLDIDPGFAPYCAQNLIDKPERVIINFGQSKNYEATCYKIIFMNPSIIMHELQRNIAELGITKRQTEITNFDELNEAIIINCTGLGAKNLANDRRIVPVQGHLITLKNQPAIQQLHYMLNFKVTMRMTQNRERDELIYFAPKDEGILGITFLRGQDSLTANQHEFERLLQRCADFFY